MISFPPNSPLSSILIIFCSLLSPLFSLLSPRPSLTSPGLLNSEITPSDEDAEIALDNIAGLVRDYAAASEQPAAAAKSKDSRVQRAFEQHFGPDGYSPHEVLQRDADEEGVEEGEEEEESEESAVEEGEGADKDEAGGGGGGEKEKEQGGVGGSGRGIGEEEPSTSLTSTSLPPELSTSTSSSNINKKAPRVIESFSCAFWPPTGHNSLSPLVHGRIFVTANAVYFVGWGNLLHIVNLSDIATVTKEKTAAGAVDNGLEIIDKEGGTHFFGSFAFRQNCFALIDRLRAVKGALIESGLVEKPPPPPLPPPKKKEEEQEEEARGSEGGGGGEGEKGGGGEGGASEGEGEGEGERQIDLTYHPASLDKDAVLDKMVGCFDKEVRSSEERSDAEHLGSCDVLKKKRDSFDSLTRVPPPCLLFTPSHTTPSLLYFLLLLPSSLSSF